MELSRAVASTALVLGILLVVGHARGGDEAGEPRAQETLQKKLEKREDDIAPGLDEADHGAEPCDRR